MASNLEASFDQRGFGGTSPSFPNPAQTPDDIPESNLSDSTTPFSDLTIPDTIVFISQPSGQSCAVMGGIHAARMKVLGAQSVIVDGRVRDLASLGELGLPVWARGTSVVGAGAETKFHAKGVQLKIGDVLVEQGDVVMVDPAENGVVVVPRARLDDVLGLLPGLVSADEMVLRDVERGGSVKDAFDNDVWDTFSHPSPDAEASGQGGQASTKTPASGTDEESSSEKDVNKSDAKGDDGGEQGHKPSGGDDEEEEEEEEEETVDPKDQLEEECKSSKGCAPAKHHFDECTERVTGQIESDGKAKEDCVEEFFHLAHCATNCAAPKLFAQLK
ncbi:hypothetical protein K504DRAFT_484052 [Pleomassaria siparia CBS 279.74]|uniref:Cytochrome b-c1 complex subunit 6, mitochondrial n=1 Tax=Pleomassaria siparia CBS 279.74 TaxID=1314801 RepID=A0A6G1K0X1_9PLEO|nr:hypothetical protein K504DRAFT_484052 [Pleomassaria siparia CBS 279.74]